MNSKIPTIGVNEFVKRQTSDSEFTHYQGTWGDLVELVAKNFMEAKPGYRDGVCLVPVPAERFYTGIVELKEGDRLLVEYKPRRPGEEPRKQMRLLSNLSKTPAVAVDIVLYRKDVLAEKNEGTTDCDWEIISINGRMTAEEQPIDPDTLIANHFELSGGTATGMSPEEFEKALRKSVLYWKNKALFKTPSRRHFF